MGPKSLKTAVLVESLPEDPDVGTSLVCSENSRKGEGTRVKRGGGRWRLRSGRAETGHARTHASGGRTASGRGGLGGCPGVS